MGNKKESLTIAWCDNGKVEGKFASSLMKTLVETQINGIESDGVIRIQGGNIARQRQQVLNNFYDTTKSDWLMWVDSDVVLTTETMMLLWNAKDKQTRPIVNGVYFVTYESEKPLMEPLPSIFQTQDGILRPVHPLPHNQVIPIDAAGFGLVLMHRSVVPKIREVCGDISCFNEILKANGQFVSEDITFFKNAKKAGIPVFAHTGALANHLKMFSFDINYYCLYWSQAIEGKLFKKTY